MQNMFTLFTTIQPIIASILITNIAHHKSILRTKYRWLKNQFEFVSVFFFDEKGLRRGCAMQMKIELTSGTGVTEGFALEPARIAAIGSRGVGWSWNEGQWMRGVRWVLHGPGGIEASRVEKIFASGAAVKRVFHHFFAAVAFDFFAVLWFYRYQQVLVAEMLLRVVPHLIFLFLCVD